MKKLFSISLFLLHLAMFGQENILDSTYHIASCGYSPAWNAEANNKYYGAIGAPIIATRSTTRSAQFVTQNSYPVDSIVYCGKFRIYYEDRISIPQAGFYNPVYGQNARNTLCDVLTYIQSVFVINDTIDYFVERSYTPVIFPAPALYTPLAAAGPYFVPGTYGFQPGIYAGNFFEHANTGIDPDINNYDAHLIVNFDQYYNSFSSSYIPITYQANDNAASLNCWFDLYSVLLHEVEHSMGWVSSIQEDNLSVNLDAMAGSGNDSCFTLYDWKFLHLGNVVNTSSFTGNKLVTGTQNSPYLNPAINTHIYPLRSDSIWLYDTVSPVNQGVYSGQVDPGIAIFSISLLSHLDYQFLSFDGMNQYSPCYRPHYVIGPFFKQGERRRELTYAEIRAFLYLGYALNPSFAASTSLNGTQTNSSLINQNQPPYRNDIANRVSYFNDINYDDHITAGYQLTNNNTPLSQNISQLTIDITQDSTFVDNDGDPITIMPGSLFGIRGVSLNGNNHGRLIVNSNLTQVTYTPEPGFWGRAQFGFYLWDGRERGAFEIYTIEVLPGTYTPPFGNEMVINGNFEDGSEIRQDTGSTTIENSPLYADGYEGMGFEGNNAAGGHPHSYVSNYWLPGAAGFIVKNSKWGCQTAQIFPEMFGSTALSWHYSFGFYPPGKVDTTINERYSKLGPAYYNTSEYSIYSTLNTKALSCTQYIFSFDINMSRTTLQVGDTFRVILGFISDPRNNPATVISYDTANFIFTIDSLAPGYWQHISDTVTYCGGASVDFIGIRELQFTPGGTYHQPLVDNLSLKQIVPLPLTIVADNNPATFDPGSTFSVCGGETVTLGASDINHKCGVSYDWQPGGATTTSINISSTVNTTYTLTVIDCSDTATALFHANVYPAPTVDAGIDATVCPGQSIVIGEDQQNNLSISWSPASTLASDTVENPLATPTATTTYTITVTDGNGCSSNDSVLVTVLPAGSALCTNCLVPNPGFETIQNCPSGLSQLSLAETWGLASLGSSDLDHFCAPVSSGVNVPNNSIFGTVTPMVNPPGQSGYAGLRTFGTSGNNTREYLETRLNCTLDSGQRYKVGFYTHVAPNCLNGYNNIGMYLSSLPTYAANSVLPINVIPQVNSVNPIINADDWVFVGDTSYMGNGEQYITIGNFYDDTSTTSQNNGTTGTYPFGYYFVDNVIAVPQPPSITASSLQVCSGSCTVLSATGANNYSWTDGTNTYTGSTVTVCPTVSTTYTVTSVTSCGVCDPVSSTVEVKVLPAPVVDAGADLQICPGEFIQLQATTLGNGPFTYSWTPVTNLSSDTIMNPSISSYNGSPATYNVTVTDDLGCTALDSIHITPGTNCCTAALFAPDTIYTSTITGGSLAINHDVYISGTVTFNGVDVRIASGYAIIELPSATLHITNQSHLHACQEMWQGIQEDTNSTLIVDQSSLIEDASSAVRTTANAPSTTVISEAIFNKNRINVEAQPYAGTLALAITNSRFTCRQLPVNPTVALLTPAYLKTLPSVNLIAPMTTLKSFTAVNATDVNSATVGAASVNMMNVMDNMEHGIFGTNSDVVSLNNLFQCMAGKLISCPGPPNPCPPTPGIAILLSDPTLDPSDPSTYNSVKVGGAGLARNYFVDCYEAVDVTDYVNYDITNDTIYSSVTTIAPPAINNLNGGHGIFVRTRLSLSMNIRLNEIVNQANAVHVMASNGGAYFNSFHINQNHISAQSTSSTFMNNGIFVEGNVGVLMNQNNYIFVDSNTVLNARMCIYVRNFVKCQTYIENNTELFIRPDASSNVGPNSAGVMVQNMNKATINNNPNIHSTGTNYSTPNHRNIRGVYVIKSTGIVTCNVVHNTGQSYVFESTCYASMWKKNDLSLSYDGFVLRNNGVIGQQGNSTHPSDNRWLGGAGSFVFSQTLTENTTLVNTNSPIWVRSTGVWNPTNNQTIGGTPYIPNTIGSSFIAASCPAPTVGENNPDMAALNAAIAQDAVVFVDNSDEERIALQKQLYTQIQDDPNLLIGDTVMQNFNAENQTSGIGLMKEVEDQAAQGDLANAAGTNAAIVPTTMTETNQQLLNDILLSTLMVGNYDLTQEQLDVLWNIAEQCPDEGGVAVWEAQSTLNWVLHDAIDFADSCAPSSARMLHPDHFSANGSAGTVYPNPTAGIVTVNYMMHDVMNARFEICDVTGRVLFAAQLDPNVTHRNIELVGLANGTYIYKLIGDDVMVNTGTLIITR